jgi:integration host factor subunit alpha
MDGKISKQNTVTREYLARTIKAEVGLTSGQSAKIIDDIINTIIGNICKKVDIKIRLFGTFTSKSKKERLGRNPRTMAETIIPARQVVKFKVAPTLKKRINENIESIK